MRWPTSVKSASRVRSSSSARIWVPTGTLMTRSLPPAPVRLRARAALAARRPEMLGVAEVDQRIEAGHRLEHDVAALAAVAAVGPAIFDELLAPEADRAGAARAGADEDLGLVEKMHGRRT